MSEEVRTFLCPQCGEPSRSNVHGIVQTWVPESGPPAEFSLLQCSQESCQMPIVQVREDYGGGFGGDKPVIYYPSPRRLSVAVPRKLRVQFGEALKCFEVKAYRATVAMVRATLEGTCRDQGATQRTLSRSLKQLEEQGKINGTLAEWADLLRVVGNKGAHFDGPVSPQDAEDALGFAEALLDHLYVLRARFDEFKSRQ